MHGSLAQIPQVEKLLSHHDLSDCIEKLGRPIVASIVSEYIKQIRAAALKGAAVPSFDTCIADIRQRCTKHIRKRISKIINATGIILHTNLGRSPLPHGIWDAAKEAAQSYSAIEMDLEDGKRGQRFPFAVEAMSTLVRAEAALMLNNNAAAVFLLLKALASGKEVIVARGQQVQIGGGFRIPDILREAGCTLVEVGTTNITTLEDITAAVTEQTAMVLWVHTSNYKIRGFTEQPSLSAIRQALPPEIILAVDQGSGVISLSLQDEPTVPALLKEGADLVCFSGDKVFGGPQCGWITGKKDLIALIARHPLMRTYRVGRAVAALMEETLVHYLNNGKSAAAEALLLDPAVIKKRSEKLVRKLPSGTACVVPYPFSLGGGSTPDETFPSWAIMLHTHKPEAVKTALRFCSIPIIAIISEDRLLLHLAAVNPADDTYIIKELQDISKNSPGF